MRDEDGNSWELPGGMSQEEEEEVGWDIGSRIGALQSIVEEQFNVEAIPRMSYIEDIQSEGGVCRFYGYRDSDGGLESPAAARPDCEWFTTPRLREILGEKHPINRIVQVLASGRSHSGQRQGRASGQAAVQLMECSPWNCSTQKLDELSTHYPK